MWINNTPLVIMLLPVVENWSITHGIPTSYVLMPLSYASMLGGDCTLLGTGNNLLINSLLEEAHMKPLKMFEMTLPGIIVGIIAIIYMV